MATKSRSPYVEKLVGSCQFIRLRLQVADGPLKGIRSARRMPNLLALVFSYTGIPGSMYHARQAPVIVDPDLLARSMSICHSSLVKRSSSRRRE